VIVYLAFLAIPLGGLYHVVVSFAETLYLVFAGRLALLTGLTGFVLPVLAGNTVGGVLLVTVVNYFQTTENRLESARFAGADRQLSVREWALGGLVGRSYVPLVDTGQHPAADAEGRRIMVAIANPRTGSYLIDLACTVARGEEGTTVHAVHVVQTPRGQVGRQTSERITAASQRRLDDLRGIAEEYEVPFEASTVVTHRSFEEALDVAARDRADLVVMSWDDTDLWAAGRSRRSLHELARGLPCDLLVATGPEVDVSRILLPTAGSTDSDLAAELVGALRAAADSAVSLLHVVDEPADREVGERFLDGWAADHGLGDAATIVDTGGDVGTAIREHAADHTLAVVGATDRGLLWRLLTDTLRIDAVEEVNCSVLLVERPTDRGLLDRLLGRR